MSLNVFRFETHIREHLSQGYNVMEEEEKGVQQVIYIKIGLSELDICFLRFTLQTR